MSSPELRVGVVGVGSMGADHAERIAHRIAGARVVAVNDADDDRAAQLASELGGGVRSVADPYELISDPAIDAVVIASPSDAHEAQVLACLEHQKFTLCEKPLTTDTASSLRLVEAEHQLARRLVQVGFMRRFDPEYSEMHAMLASGDYGRTLLLHNVHRNESAPDWFRSDSVIRDSMVHEVDIARFLLGEEIAEITMFASVPTSNAKGILDPQVAIFRMTSGTIVTTEVFVNCSVGYEVRCEAVAERGSIVIGRNSSGVSTTRSNGSWGGQIPRDYRVRFARAYDLEVQAWVNASRLGTCIGPSMWDGYAATAVCAAGVESLQSGRPVAVELAPNPGG